MPFQQSAIKILPHESKKHKEQLVIHLSSLQKLLTLHCCIGIIGGKPKHSLFFIGFQGLWCSAYHNQNILWSGLISLSTYLSSFDLNIRKMTSCCSWTHTTVSLQWTQQRRTFPWRWEQALFSLLFPFFLTYSVTAVLNHVNYLNDCFLSDQLKLFIIPFHLPNVLNVLILKAIFCKTRTYNNVFWEYFFTISICFCFGRN